MGSGLADTDDPNHSVGLGDYRRRSLDDRRSDPRPRQQYAPYLGCRAAETGATLSAAYAFDECQQEGAGRGLVSGVVGQLGCRRAFALGSLVAGAGVLPP